MTLNHLIRRQNDQLKSLVSLLSSEQEDLIKPQSEGTRWLELSEAKHELCADINALEAQRRDLLQGFGYTTDQDGSTKAAKELGCGDEWEALQEMARRAAELNSTNGALLSQRMEHNGRVLATLTDIAGKTLYGSDGQHQRSGNRLSVSV